MRFGRPRIITHPTAGIDPATGLPHTTAVETQSEVTNLVLGNGTSTWDIVTGRDAETGNFVRQNVQSVALPAAAYDNEALFELGINGNKQIFVHVHTEALGATGLTGVTMVLEFNDPDYPNLWIPSSEGVGRANNFAAHEIALVGLGDWVVATREEHRQFTRWRARFRATAGAADANTQIIVGWAHDGGINLVNNDSF